MDKTDSSKKTLINYLLCIAFFLALIYFYLPMTKHWFFSDDIQWIWSSASLSFREIFFVPEKYRAMASNFTPMLGASFKIDWMLSGMNPLGYTLHSLLSLLAAAGALYCFLRLYVSGKTAFAGVLLFVLNPITLSVTGWFSTRHYMEGLFWALLSLTFFVKGERKGKVSIASGIFYLLASLNKEVYVVLPAIALLLSGDRLLKRLTHTLPLWSGLVVYSLWRLWIMGGIGGYPSNQPLHFETLIPLFLKTIKFFSLQWFGEYSIVLYLFLTVAFLLSLKKMKLLFIFLILSIPLLPVSNIFDAHYSMGRYFFHTSVFVICVLSLLLEPTSKERALYKGAIFLVCLFITAMFIKQDIRISAAMQSERLRAKETAATFLSSGKRYINAEQPSWFYEGLRNIYSDFFSSEITTLLVPPEGFLRYASPERLREIRESGIGIPYDEIRESQRKFRKGPLTVRITLEDYKLIWDFGPRKDVTYTLLRGLASGLYYNSSDLRSTGNYMLGKGSEAPSSVYIRIFYRSEGGEEVISPEFELTIPGSRKIEYISTR